MKPIQFLKVNALAIAAVMVAGTTMSFKMAEKRNAPQTFYYISDDMSPNAFRNVSHWSTTNDTEACESSGSRPCAITVPENSSLNAVLGSKDNDQVLAISEGFKQTP